MKSIRLSGAAGILALGLSGLPLPRLSAATYYVDYAAGADSNRGTATALAFKHCPGDSAATATAAGTVLDSGDTVIFKGGVTYQGQTIVCAGGVTYDGNSAGTFGTGRAVLSGGHGATYTKCFSATGLKHLTFDHLIITQWGHRGSRSLLGRASRSTGWGVYLDGCASCTVKGCYIYDIGDWLNQANADGGHFGGVGVQVIHSGSNIAITGNEFTEIGLAAIQANAFEGTTPTVHNLTIAGNNIHDNVVWGINLAVSQAKGVLNGVTIDGNRFHDLWQYSSGSWLGTAGSWPHTDEIICFLGGVGGGQLATPVSLGTVADPIVIRHNLFYNDVSPSLTGGTACVFLCDWGGRVLVYGNVFDNVLNHGEGSIYAQDGAGAGNPVPDYWFVNNTFYDDDYAVVLRTVTAPLSVHALTTGVNGTIRVKNNIFYKANNDAAVGVVFGLDNYSRPTELDYNIYRTGRTDGVLAYGYNPNPPTGQLANGYRTLAQLQAQGYETHGRQADPKYVDISFGLGASSSSNDLHLQSSSPAIGAGLNLSSILSALTDASGAAWPSTGSWDAGAYQQRRP